MNPETKFHHGHSALEELTKIANRIKGNQTTAFLLTDKTVEEKCLPYLSGKIDGFAEIRSIVIEPGEQNKSLGTCIKIWQHLTEQRAERDSILINLGGGMVCDVGGFAAASYMRGIGFVNIPTTLLAMSDASFGGKTGINFLNRKNMIGSFYEPESVFIIPGFLQTLDRRNILSGFAEMLKHALIADRGYWNELRMIEPEAATVKDFIKKNIEIKHKIITEDFKENGLRKVLNFGHTIGHAIESAFIDSGKDILHGEAVAAGMLCETWLSAEMKFLGKSDFNEIADHLLKTFALPELDSTIMKSIFSFLGSDKKNKDGKNRFTLLSAPGKALTEQSCDSKLVLSSLEFYKSALLRS